MLIWGLLGMSSQVGLVAVWVGLARLRSSGFIPGAVPVGLWGVSRVVPCIP